MKFDLTIAYRIYPGVSKTPAIFSDDKYKMSELCIKSFADGIKGLNAKIYVILDSCPPEYKSLFTDNLSNFNLEFIELEKAGNTVTFNKQIELLCNADSDFVYFAEDDFFYLENSITDLLDFAKSNNIDFATSYDHLDYYTEKLHKNKFKEKKLFKNKEYYTHFSTTLTFLSSKKALIENRGIFESFLKKNWDVSLWFVITTNYFRNPLKFIQLCFFNLQMFKMYVKAYLLTFKYVFRKKKYKLWVETPGTATHLEKAFLGPGVNWYEEFKKYL